ncbi:MAG TPA: zinc-ribbon domain-containing protein [Vicinamibacteria bacterium]|nr:zinc-ribbon domain-containing protein [Vicinamibacteria bacterium]
MQAQCSQCSTRIQIDDTKVPDRPFKVRCPKCQTVMTLPGRGADAPAAPEAEPPPPASEAPPASGPEAAAPPPYEPPPPPSPEATARRERAEGGANDALIALSGPAATGLRQALERLKFNVDSVDDIEEGARLLEQGVYEVAVTARTPAEPGKPETLAQRMLRLPIDARRRVFVILVGEEFRTADGTQAWAAQADLVVNPADAGRCEHLIRSTMTERKRLYQPLVDARRKIESD